MRGDTEITNREDIIDSREVIDRIEYLEDERTRLEGTIENAQDTLDNAQNSTDEEKETQQETLEEWDESDYWENVGNVTDRYGLCEVCHCSVETTFYQVECRKTDIGWTYHGCHNLFGHKECLEKMRKE